MKLSQIKRNPNNPRVIRDERFEKLKKSIEEFPKMMAEIDSLVFVSEDMATMGKSKNGKVKFRLKECSKCKNWFSTKEPKRKFCSKDCHAESMKINKPCKQCGKIIENKHSVSLKNRKYCSKECQSEARRGQPLPEKWKRALSEGRKSSEKCRGESLYNWKGGKENQRIIAKERYYRTKHNIIGKIPRNALKKILSLQKNSCFYCESDLSEYKAIEHLTPVTRNGDNSIYNLVYSCKSCNSKKSQQTLEEYAISQRRFDWLAKWEYIFINIL